MTWAYWSVLIAGLLPYFWVALAKKAPQFDNRAPREYLASVEGWRKRAAWAHNNAFEVLPLFIAAVIIAQLTQVAQPRVDGLAAAFIIFRILHGVFYIADRATLRSLAFAAGLVCVLGLFLSAANLI